MKIGQLCLLAVALLPLVARGSAQPNDQAPAGFADHVADHAAADVAAPAPAQDAIPALPVPKPKHAPVSEEERIARKVRHELVMQPYYTIWDWLAFRVNGSTVELLGDVYSLGLKRDAVDTVKHIAGVERVIDHINQLPPSPMDDRIRRQVARAIFSWGTLSRYSWPAVPSIHVIVNGGQVWLEGVVDNQPDKDVAGLRANGVSGVFQVTNDLRVEKD
jgi:hyperosmotically inducible periplasmic protein